MYGKLGHSGEECKNSPCKVQGLKDVRRVACGSRHTVCLLGDSTLYSWGEKRDGVTGLGEPLLGLVSSPQQILLRGEYDENGQFIDASDASFKIEILVACGFHSAFTTARGSVFLWGQGRFGRLGTGHEENVASPTQVKRNYFVNKKVRDVSCGGFHSAAITEDGELYVWGGGEHGQLGLGEAKNSFVPKKVLTNLLTGKIAEIDKSEDYIVEVHQVVCGWSHTTCTISVKKKCYGNPTVVPSALLSWGNNDHGKLGLGSTVTAHIPEPIQGLMGVKIVYLASYNEHTLALCERDSATQNSQLSALSKDLACLFEAGEDMFADIVFRVDGKLIHAHKCILSARCSHFRAMFRNKYRETNQGEVAIGGEGSVSPEVTYETFKCFIQFLYTQELKLSEEANRSEVLVKVFMLADYYESEMLKKKCMEMLRRTVDATNAPRTLQAACTLHAGPIRDEWMIYIVNHLEQVSSTDGFRELDKDIICEILEKKFGKERVT